MKIIIHIIMDELDNLHVIMDEVDNYKIIIYVIMDEDNYTCNNGWSR